MSLNGYLHRFKSDVFLVMCADLCSVKSGVGLSKWCVGHPPTDPKPCTAGVSRCGKVWLWFCDNCPCVDAVLEFFGPWMSACPTPPNCIAEQLSTFTDAKRQHSNPLVCGVSGVAQHVHDNFMTVLTASRPLVLVCSGLYWLPCLTHCSRCAGIAFFRVCRVVLPCRGGPFVLLTRSALGVIWSSRSRSGCPPLRVLLHGLPG